MTMLKNTLSLVISLSLCLPISAKTITQKTDFKHANEKVSAQKLIELEGIPWGMAWLPNGDMLITMRGGTLRMVKQGTLIKETISGLPKIAVANQGGLLDIAVHPNYEENGWIYFSYSRPDGSGNKSTAIMRAKLKGMSLIEQEDIFIAQAYSSKSSHFGSRITFDRSGYLYFSVGDRGQRDKNPQDLTRDAGKVYRLHDDGKIPADNPFVKNELAKPAIFSYGHRNPQGMALHPKTGAIWTHEHGPRGGDEINIINKGKNYGWPVISYGVNYSGSKFTELTEKQGMEQPLWYWDPSIAPSGMSFITGNKYPSWQGNVVVGSLKFGYVLMLTLRDEQVIKQEIIKDELTRVRNVQQGPDGYLYVAVDGQGIYKLMPQQ